MAKSNAEIQRISAPRRKLLLDRIPAESALSANRRAELSGILQGCSVWKSPPLFSSTSKEGCCHSTSEG
jgi:hypothetical protein